MTDYNFYNNNRVRRHVSDKYRALLYSFGKTIDEHFHGNVDNYIKSRQMFATLRKAACKGKGKTLTDEQSKQLAIYKEQFRKYGALPKRFLQIVVKIDGKPQRVPKQTILIMLRQTGFKFVSHGKHFTKNEHWSNFAMPKFSRIKELYTKYKKLEETMTKEEKEAIYKKYEDGKGAFISPEAEIKSVLKKEKSAARRKQTIAKNAIEASIAEFAKMKQRLAELEAENKHLKSLKDLNSDIPEEKEKEKEKEEELVIEYEDLDKYFPDGIDQDNPEHRELMKHFSEHCKMRLDYEYENQHKAMMEEKPMTDDEAEAQIAAAERLRDSGELNKEEFKEEPPSNVAVVKQDKTTIPPDDDIPTEEEQLAQRKKLLSYRLQEFHNKGYLQASEAERLRQCSTYADKLPKIKDNGVILSDTSKQFDARLRICTYINKHKEEFGLDLDVVDLDALHKELYRWVVATAKCCAAAC